MGDYFAIFKKKISDMDKLTESFRMVTDQFIEHEQHAIELARVLQDDEAVLKSQIKLSVMKHARQVFEDCYKLSVK